MDRGTFITCLSSDAGVHVRLLPSFRGARAAVRVATTAMKRPREGDVTDDVELGEIVARPREDADGASESEEGALPVPLPANPAPADAVYGGDARASVELKPEHALGLKLSSVHELITWVMTDRGANPRWAFVRNKPLVSRVVLLLVPGLDRARCASSAELMPNTRAALGVGLPTTFDNPTANELNVARALLCSVSDRAPNAGVARERRGVAAARSSRARAMDRTRAHPPQTCADARCPFPPRTMPSPPRLWWTWTIPYPFFALPRRLRRRGRILRPRLRYPGFRRDAAQRGRRRAFASALDGGDRLRDVLHGLGRGSSSGADARERRRSGRFGAVRYARASERANHGLQHRV